VKNLFIDTNIIIDLLANRKPFSKYAIELFQGAEERKYKLFVSSHSIATTHYILKRHIEEKALRILLNNLLDYVTVIPIDGNDLRAGLRSKQPDFEDSLQMICAYSVEKLECIITRNVKDFKACELPVYSPDEFFLK
jgi:predicted nucleic acid-binding protein